MPYVDGFVLPIPKRKVQAYLRIARVAGRLWKKYGALEYRECVGDDLRVKGAVSFLRMARAKPGETVLFAWIVYKSKAHRDRVNAKVMKDPRLLAMMEPAQKVADMRRMAMGGFKTLVDL
ncbi:MAG: DUF1428 domain-containing protein [Gemmatimonadales bacterium]|nr:DUF1428 domain-containing protein [Gemmatimonadales bacterium]